MNTKSHDITFIIPCYNCAEYLPDAIDSVLTQDIGFEGSIQLILVNDGSTDDTDIVCKSYQEHFPANIAYIRQDNQGASAARLTGLKHATGAYINFLDADDRWSTDACSSALSFFNKHPGTAFCAAAHTPFGSNETPHPLAYKYEKDGVVNILTDPGFPHLSLNNAFIRRELINEAYFDNTLKYGEDCLVINKILLETPIYGVLKDPKYYYRKREDNSSAMNSTLNSASWYLDTPQKCFLELYRASREKYGRVLPYIQYVAMYDLQWRLNKNSSAGVLSSDEELAYRTGIFDLLSAIDEKVVLAQRNMPPQLKLATLDFLQGKAYGETQHALYIVDQELCYKANDTSELLTLCSIEDVSFLYIDFITPNGSGLTIEGTASAIFPPEELGIRVEENTARVCPRSAQAEQFLFEQDYCSALGFTVEVPNSSFSIDASFKGQKLPVKIKAHKHCSLTFKPFAYAHIGNYILKPAKQPNAIRIAPATLGGLLAAEAAYEASVPFGQERRGAIGLMKYRRFAFAQKYMYGKGRRIWLISDRYNHAGDNGEALFTYLQSHPVEGVDTYFVLDSKSEDFERVSQIGPVVQFGSSEHIRLQLIAQKLISSSADHYQFNRFGKYSYLFRDLNTAPFVFLQHGITQNDLSEWLNRYNKNISLIVTASPREAEAFLSNPAYAYSPEVIVQTGFPRHDTLIELNETIPTEKRILIAPTWRQYLTCEPDTITGLRSRNPAFTQSDFFNFYNSLINDSRIDEATRAAGYSVEFLIHPSLSQEAGFFQSNFVHISSDYNYQMQFARSAIMLTDYSSVAFDFALLKRPVIYAQFDKDTFFQAHTTKPGYFSYEEDGFGQVCYDYESTVAALLAAIENPQMPQQYTARVDSFFYVPETSRCEEVVQAILNMN